MRSLNEKVATPIAVDKNTNTAVKDRTENRGSPHKP
jgi:hypothetical protein